MANWSPADIPLQDGKVAIVTGANSGLGFEIACGLAAKGATLLIAGRSEAKGLDAVARIVDLAPKAVVAFDLLDLADMASVRAFAARVGNAHPRIDILVNNAGVAMTPRRETTKDGFELQLATNYLGHFLLTSLLLPNLLRSAAARVVNQSSLGHRLGPIDFDNLQGEHKYSTSKAYGQSKLAMLLFARELERRSEENGWPLLAMPVHPGFSKSNLMVNGPRHGGVRNPFYDLIDIATPLFGQSTARGAEAALFAATSPDAKGGQYYGPAGIGGLKGPVGLATVGAYGLDKTAQRRLWDVSCALTGADWAPTTA